MTEMAVTQKRQVGLVKDGKWLVLTESTGEEDVGFVHQCGEEILGKVVTFPIHDGPFPCSGSGRCETQTVPYCPSCEIEPQASGMPITRL